MLHCRGADVELTRRNCALFSHANAQFHTQLVKCGVTETKKLKNTEEQTSAQCAHWTAVSRHRSPEGQRDEDKAGCFISTLNPNSSRQSGVFLRDLKLQRTPLT